MTVPARLRVGGCGLAASWASLSVAGGRRDARGLRGRHFLSESGHSSW